MTSEKWNKFKVSSKRRSKGNYFPFIIRLNKSIEPNKGKKWKSKLLESYWS
jgi:hypothetical protein